MEDQDKSNIHATAIVVNGFGCLIRGKSGSGKSLLALDLLNDAGAKGALVADDRTIIAIENERLVARCPSALQGRIELRGYGILDWPMADSAKIDLVIDLVDHLVRMPETSEFSCNIIGINLNRVPVPNRNICDGNHQKLLVHAAFLDFK